MTRTEILKKKFRGQVANGIPLVGGGAGTGITVKSAEAGGIDLLVIYNSGRFRMAGRGSLSGFSLTAMPMRSPWTWRARYCPSSSTPQFLPELMALIPSE